MPVDEDLVAAIIHSEWMRWSQIFEQYMSEEGKSRVAEMAVRYEDLPDGEKELFLKSARSIHKMYEREAEPEV